MVYIVSHISAKQAQTKVLTIKHDAQIYLTAASLSTLSVFLKKKQQTQKPIKPKVDIEKRWKKADRNCEMTAAVS